MKRTEKCDREQKIDHRLIIGGSNRSEIADYSSIGCRIYTTQGNVGSVAQGESLEWADLDLDFDVVLVIDIVVPSDV